MKRICLAGAVLAFLTPHLWAQDSTWTHNDAMLTFFQAAGAIREHALEEVDFDAIVHTSLQAYLAAHDPYSVLFTPTEYTAYRAARENRYNGIGMELAKTKEGTYYCIPYPDGPAALAGIVEKDELLAVDDQPISGQPLEKVGARIRGESGTSVNLTLRTSGKDTRELAVKRSPLRALSVTRSRHEGATVLRIHSFTANTPSELRTAIRSLQKDAPIVIDLRGNPGGNLFDAVDTARLFLAPDQTIAEVRNRTETTVYQSERPPSFPERPVWILQDEGTASAAEVFAAALTQNGRARSIGQVSFGKGLTQRFIELMDGSALLLTDGELLPPSGTSFDGQGLPPTIHVDEGPILPALLPLLQRDPPETH